MGLILRVKQGGTFADVKVKLIELSAGAVLECLANEKDSDTVFSLAALMLVDENNNLIFQSPEDVSKRLSSKSTRKLSNIVFQEIGVGDEDIAKVKKK